MVVLCFLIKVMFVYKKKILIEVKVCWWQKATKKGSKEPINNGAKCAAVRLYSDS